MEEKLARWEAIRQVIGTQTIQNQEGLLSHLKKLGFNVTQATLSRDLKSLKVIKSPNGDGGYLYSLPFTILNSAYKEGYIEGENDLIFFAKAFLSIAFSNSLGVIKTLPGYANSLAAHIDKLQLPEILGTVAGDDTILVVLKEGVTSHQVLVEFAKRIPLIKDKLGPF
jgi:transcriptional regulator of arginine metabolism